MQTLIVYMSHHGTTHKVAMWLQEKLGTDTTTVVNLEKDKLPDLSEYSTVLIGGSIHIGQIQKKIKAFCDKNLDLLLKKNIGLFLCFMDIEHGQKEFDHAFPAELRHHAKAKGLFGGELIFAEMNFFEKLMTKSIISDNEPVTGLNIQNMLDFEQSVKALINKS